MSNSDMKNKDHNYTEKVSDNYDHSDIGTWQITENNSDKSLSIEYINMATQNKDIIGGQIKNINELKKITPRVKLVGRDVSSLNELTKINKSFFDQKITANDHIKQELKKYCRTCAGSKLPLVDIFSEKGIQMRLSQQMKHLEEINQHDCLSTQMCMDCICDLKMSYKFFMQIKKAEVKLRSIYASLANVGMKKTESGKQPISVVIHNSQNSDNGIQIKNSISEEYKEEPNVSIEGSSIFSTQNLDVSSTNIIANINELPIESEKIDETVRRNSDDNESIEEFDPDDPPFHPDTSDNAESEDIEDGEQTPRKRFKKEQSFKKLTNPFARSSTLREDKKDISQTIYKYDMALQGYIKINENKTIVSGIETTDAPKDLKQPNILKRRMSTPMKKEIKNEPNDNITLINSSNATSELIEPKIQKLNISNPLSVTNAEQDGIMYVTVKGSKPNEILLVKVKKMDKTTERKDEKIIGKKSTELKPMDKILKTLSKDKDSFSGKKPDMRELIIEEQIEEYKKKREKVLGGQAILPTVMKEELTPRFVRHESDSETVKMDISNEESSSTKADNLIVENDNSCISLEQESIEDIDLDDKSITDDDMIHELKAESTEEGIQRPRIRVKYEKEFSQYSTDGNLEKLSKILGEPKENLIDFQDYLKQRRIVLSRLKDEDIISLYEDRSNALQKKMFPDLIDETHPQDYIPEEHYLECDYCPETFASKEVLEDHLKSHDFKIMHYCEDCNEEFSTNKAKRNHNVVCIKKLICRYCDTCLESKGKKRQHEQKHCDNMFGQLCHVCGEKFKHHGTLDQHIKTQHKSWEKIFQCPKCPKKFAFKQKLSFHLKSVHTTMRAYLCEDCGADFKNPASLRHHRIRKHQPVNNIRECPVCHKMIPFYSLSKHMHTHKAYTIQCPHCEKMFKNSSTLKQHVRIHEDQRQYRCDTCGVGFNRRDGLRLHMRVHEKTDSRGLKECSCQVCGEKFPNHSTLVIHRNRVHKDGRQYTCHICNRSMISTRSLEWHMSHIHNESLPGIVKDDSDGSQDKKRVSCYHCNKTFKTEMILRTHIKNTHMHKDPMKCLDCELTFTSEVRLRHHMMVVHNRLEGTLPCPHCPKRFVNQLRLKTHMISHSEERPYTCEICGFNLKTKIQLIKHHQNRHSDERPLQCRYCPWRCKQVSALVCHERTHTNERPYSCSVCRQRFKYLGDKNKHERRHESLGGSGFKRIAPGRNMKPKVQDEDTTSSEQDREGLKNVEAQLTEEQYEEGNTEDFDDKFENAQIVKLEGQEIGEYEEVYKQEYEETSREASEAAEVIMNMEDTTVYTEEVTADNIESAEIMTDEMMATEIFQSGTVVHLQQQDDNGKIQVIPVMLSLPDLSDTSAEVNLATASIMYNN